MPQNQMFLTAGIKRGLNTVQVLKAKPGTVVSVLCLTPGTIDLINDVTTGGAGLAIAGFPATMVAGQLLPLNSSASVGISVKAPLTGSYNVVFS
jgi:hypothetical protein